jgi:hypothetical protein
VKAALSAMTVKTDRKDARGLAQLIRMGWFRPDDHAPNRCKGLYCVLCIVVVPGDTSSKSRNVNILLRFFCKRLTSFSAGSLVTM